MEVLYRSGFEYIQVEVVDKGGRFVPFFSFFLFFFPLAFLVLWFGLLGFFLEHKLR